MAKKRWLDIPLELRETMQESSRQTMFSKKRQAEWRREQRVKEGVGRRGVQVRASISTRDKLRAISDMEQGLALMQDRDVTYIGWRKSASESLRRLVEKEYEKLQETLSYLASTDPRASRVLEKGKELAYGWQ